MSGNRLANLPQERHESLRPAPAVEADHVGARVFESLAGLAEPQSVPGRVGLVRDHRDDGRVARLLDDLEREQASSTCEKVSAMMKSTPASDAQPTCSSNIARTVVLRLGVVRIDVGIADVPGEERPALGCDLLRDRERLPVELLEQVLLPDDPHLLAVRVVRERLHDVGARVHEVAVQLRDDLGMVEHDLGHERAGLQVAAPLELEEIALGADHRALVEPLEEPFAHEPIMSERTSSTTGSRSGGTVSPASVKGTRSRTSW